MTVKAAVPVLVVLAAAAPAAAHPEFSHLGTNRYVTAAVFDGRVDVTDSWLMGALPSIETRRALDANHDGELQANELRAGEQRLRAEGALVAVELDGRASTAPIEVSIDVGGDARIGPTPLVIERRARLEGAGTRSMRLRLIVMREPDRLIETELGVVLGPGLALNGPDRVRFDGPRRSVLEDRSATFDITSTTRTKPALPFFVVSLVAVLVAFGLLRRRAQRRGIDARM